MSRKRKFKMVRAGVIVIAIFFIVITLFKTINGGDSSADILPESSTEGNNPSDNDNNNKNDKIIGLKIVPQNYTAHTGEIIDLGDFEISKEFKSGKTEKVTQGVTFEADGKILSIKENSVIVSKDAVSADKGKVKVKYDGFEVDISLEIFNSLEDNINEEQLITNFGAYDMVINKNRNLSKDYVPEDLVSLTEVPTCLASPEVNQLRKDAYEALKEMFAKAKEEKSFVLYARSGYRSYNTQSSLYTSTVNNSGQAVADKYSAKPGQSEHQTGLSMDISCEAVSLQLEDTFGDTEEGIWVKENAHRFGFIIRYPKDKEDITGYNYEPWHIRYLGEILATEVYESGLTLEEYFETKSIGL